ncbi:DUF418 domain-containing protein [Natranaerobius trueperi]|uniref:DUF418 domain-containing protein n=1 Tax=Natranaerobius trueperi TaxID=759412 RepID=UPI003B837CC0
MLHTKGYFKRLFNYFSYVGRMALTNYLIQCIVCAFVFYGYGLGYLDNMTITTGTIFTFIFFIIQMIVSKIWLSNFHYGPFEKFWRYLTYQGNLY